MKLTAQEKKIIKAFPTNTLMSSDSEVIYNDMKSIQTKQPINHRITVPDEFDGTKVWKRFLSPVLNQGRCGSCWAFATVSTLADKYNIQSEGKMHVELSPVWLLLCSLSGINLNLLTLDREEINSIHGFATSLVAVEGSILSNDACHGNSLYNAWVYLFAVGTVTLDCMPNNQELGYGPEVYKHLNEKEQRILDDDIYLPLCSNITGPTRDMCDDFYFNSRTGNITGTPAKFYSANHIYTIAGTPKNGGSEYAIRNNIYNWGPVSTSIIIYADFYTWNAATGIYRWDGKSQRVGSHAIELVGWGRKGKINYWIARNSWGTKWGRDGYFYIERGTNQCQIEENVITGIPHFFQKILIDPWLKKFKFGESKEIQDIKDKQLSDFKNSIAGGIDPITGYTRRVKEVYPWVDDLPPPPTVGPDFTNFVAGEVGGDGVGGDGVGEVEGGNKTNYQDIVKSDEIKNRTKLFIYTIIILTIVVVFTAIIVYTHL